MIYESEAHAWVEVFFPKYGWINFEPSVLRDLPFRPTEYTSIDCRSRTARIWATAPTCTWTTRTSTAFGDYAPYVAPREDVPWLIGLGVVAGMHRGRGGRLVRDDVLAAARPARPALARAVVRAVPTAGRLGRTGRAARRRRRSSTPNGWSGATRARARWSARSPSATSRGRTAATSPAPRSWRAPRRPGTRSVGRWRGGSSCAA